MDHGTIPLGLSLPSADTDRILMCNCQQLFYLSLFLPTLRSSESKVCKMLLHLLLMSLWCFGYGNSIVIVVTMKSCSNTLTVFASNAITLLSNVGRTGGFHKRRVRWALIWNWSASLNWNNYWNMLSRWLIYLIMLDFGLYLPRVSTKIKILMKN